MLCELEVYDALCATRRFAVNGVTADSCDFGDQYDDAESEAPEYGCGNMRFFPKLPSPGVLEKYNITEKEYYDIAAELAEKLSFGDCIWCV